MSNSLSESRHRHWKLLGLTIALILVLTSSVYAYWKTTTPSSPTLYVTATSPPVELRMELDKTEFQLGETVVIHLFLKNIGSETITISFNYWNDHVGFIVKTSDDTRVYEYPILFLTGCGPPVILEPGNQVSETFEWKQVYNIWPYTNQAFAAGTYKIIGRTGTLSIADKVFRIETPAIAITIG